MAAARREVLPRSGAARASCSSRPTNSPVAVRDGAGRQRHGRRPGDTSAALDGRRGRRATTAGRWRPRAGRRGEVGIVVEDRRLQLDELRRRVEPELVGEQRSGPAEHAQRVGLAAAAVQGDHQPPGEALAQRVLVDRALELGAPPRCAGRARAGRRSGPPAPRGAARPSAPPPGAPSPRRRRRRAPARATRPGRHRDGRARAPGSAARALRAAATWSSKRATSSSSAIDGEHVAGPLPTEQLRRRRAPGAAVTRSSAACSRPSPADRRPRRRRPGGRR